MYTWKKWQSEKGYPEGSLLTYRINNFLSGQNIFKKYQKDVKGKNNILIMIPNDPHNLLALDMLEQRYNIHPVEP